MSINQLVAQTSLLLEDLSRRAERGRIAIMSTALEPNRRRDRPLFTSGRIASLLKKSRQYIGRVCKELKLIGEFSNDRFYLGQDEILRLREKFDDVPPKGGEAIVVSIQNQKGGVAKTTTAAHLAHAASLRGHRVLLIDVDSQASITAYFGLNPDTEISAEETVHDILVGETNDMRKLVKHAPHFDRLDFIPACLELSHSNEACYMRTFLARFIDEARKPENIGDHPWLNAQVDDYVYYNRLKHGIDSLREDYDVIILDCPPYLSAASMNAIFATEVLIIPLGASTLDLASTLRFTDWLKTLQDKMRSLYFYDLRFLVTNYDGQQASDEVLEWTRTILGDRMLKNMVVHSPEVQRAAISMKTVYELPKAMGSQGAWARACQSMDDVNDELLEVIEKAYLEKKRLLGRAAQDAKLPMKKEDAPAGANA